MRFKISVARTAGFCFGVRRALDKTLEILNESDNTVRTLGPLIHNEQVLDILRMRGVTALGADEPINGKTIIIRAHGVTPQALKELKEDEARICNATCPKVSHVQAIVKKYARRGYDVLIVGDTGHAEVEGLLGYAEGRGRVVSGPDQARLIESFDRVCIVAQTTQNTEIFHETVEVVRAVSRECLVFDTICSATSDRQQEVLELAQRSDLMVIVGGKSSANTRRLADLAQEHCRTVLIRSPEELDRGTLEGVHRIGVTAGASTPSWVIRQVIDRIQEVGWDMAPFPLPILHSVVKYALRTNIAFSLAMALLVASAGGLLGVTFNPLHALLGFWFAFYWSTLAELFPTEHSPVRFYSRANPFREHPRRWISATLFLTVIVLILSIDSGFAAIGCLAFFMSGGFLFSCPVPRFLAKMKITRIRDYPYLKDSWFALFAASMIVLYPLCSGDLSDSLRSSGLMFAYYAILMWSRSVMLDIRDHQFDLVYGRKTLPIRLGKFRTQLVFIILIVIWLIVSVMPVWLNHAPPTHLFLVTVPLYFMVYLVMYHQRLMFIRLTSDAAVDSVLWLAIIAAFAATLLSR